MKRRDFIVGSAGAAGYLLPKWAGAVPAPCPPSTVSVSGGTSTSAECGSTSGPAWFSAMASGTWAQPTSNALAAVQVVTVKPGYGQNTDQIMAYSGGLVDNTRREFLMVANGGHGDYVGNEAYALALWADTPYWYRLVDPTPASFIWDTSVNTNVVDGTSRYYDGRSVSMHTYGIPVYVNGKVWFPAQGHTTGGSGSWVCGLVSWNRLASGIPLSNATPPVAHPGVNDTGAWQFWGGYNNSPHTIDSAASGSWNVGYSIYDPATGYVFLTNPQSSDFQYVRLNTATGAHNCYNQRSLGGGNPPYGVRWYNTFIGDRALISSKNGVMTWFHKGDSAKIYLMSTPLMGASSSVPIWREITTTGTPPTFAPGDYTGTGYAVYYGGAIYFMDWALHGSSIFRLTVPTDLVNGTWTWTVLPNTTGAVPALTGADRCYGRFNIVQMPSGAAIVCMNSTTSKPWIYKL